MIFLFNTWCHNRFNVFVRQKMCQTFHRCARFGGFGHCTTSRDFFWRFKKKVQNRHDEREKKPLNLCYHGTLCIYMCNTKESPRIMRSCVAFQHIAQTPQQIHLILWCARETFFQALIDMFFSFHFFALLLIVFCWLCTSSMHFFFGSSETCCLKCISNIDPWLFSPNKSFWHWCWSHRNYYYKLKNNAACFEITLSWMFLIPTA